MRWLKLYESYKSDKTSEMVALKRRMEKEMDELKDNIYADVSEFLYDIIDNYRVDDVNVDMDEDSQIKISMSIYCKLESLDNLVNQLESVSNRIYEALDMTIVFHKLHNINKNKTILNWSGRASLYFNGDMLSDDKREEKKKIFNDTIKYIESTTTHNYYSWIGNIDSGDDFKIGITIV